MNKKSKGHYIYVKTRTKVICKNGRIIRLYDYKKDCEISKGSISRIHGVMKVPDQISKKIANKLRKNCRAYPYKSKNPLKFYPMLRLKKNFYIRLSLGKKVVCKNGKIIRLYDYKKDSMISKESISEIHGIMKVPDQISKKIAIKLIKNQYAMIISQRSAVNLRLYSKLRKEYPLYGREEVKKIWIHKMVELDEDDELFEEERRTQEGK